MSRRFRPLGVLVLLLAGTAAAEGVTLPPAERFTLENGTVVVLVEQHEVPLIGLQAMLPGGATADPDSKEGLANLFAGLLGKGAGERDAAAFAEAIDAAGGRLSARAGREAITISGEFLARDAGLAIELLADMLQRPALDAAEFRKLRERERSFILAAKDADPGELMPAYANAFVFGDHPYGKPVSGSESSLGAITHADIRRYHANAVGGDRLLIVLAGDFDPAEMRDRVTAAFADWRPAAEPAGSVPAPDAAPGGQVLLIDKPGATQTYFWIGNIGVARGFPDQANLDIANTLFGGRFTSMLNTALRIDSGLTYGARSLLVQPRQRGTLAISSFTRTDATVEAIDMALDILGRLHGGAIDAAMIDSARNYVLGQFPTDFETASQLAAEFALLEFYGLGDAAVNGYADAMATVDVESVARLVDAVYPAADELVFVLLGDAEAIRESVKKYGAVTEMPITAPQFRPPEER